MKSASIANNTKEFNHSSPILDLKYVFIFFKVEKDHSAAQIDVAIHKNMHSTMSVLVKTKFLPHIKEQSSNILNVL
jgi:hypothetical protein